MKTLKRTLLVILAIFLVVFANGCYYVFNGQFKSAEKLSQGKDLNIYECCSIYTMHIATWLFGWPMSPTAAHECFTLHFRHKKDVIYINSQRRRLSVLSPKVVNTIKSMKGMSIGSKKRVSWNGNEAYAKNSPEHVAAIAINPCVITKEVIMAEGYAMYSISSSMQYPKYSKTKIDVGAFSITIHEGLFRYLQDKGWLSYYTAVYIVTDAWLYN